MPLQPLNALRLFFEIYSEIHVVKAGAATKSRGTDGYNACGNRERTEGGTAVKCSVAYGFDLIVPNNFRKSGTAGKSTGIERIIVYACNIFAEGDLLKGLCSSGKLSGLFFKTASDNDGFKGRAAVKGILTDCSNAIGNSYGFQGFAALKALYFMVFTVEGISTEVMVVLFLNAFPPIALTSSSPILERNGYFGRRAVISGYFDFVGQCHSTIGKIAECLVGRDNNAGRRNSRKHKAKGKQNRQYFFMISSPKICKFHCTLIDRICQYQTTKKEQIINITCSLF